MSDRIKYIISFVIFISFFEASFLFCQSQIDALKIDAKKEMNIGKYGEAIELLNKYISARPQEADGYNLRGLCYQKRSQFDYAVYDFRSARKLQPGNSEINKNLSETTDTWYKSLYNKIEGHKREIAIYPKRPANYLEIGKAYKNLGEWLIAEIWYDKYLALEDASPDEILRYTEILAQNNHIQKGEPILKNYVARFPVDHRLWSRYGYFELWLGKKKNAVDAFEKALALKPYFKEAMNGLDIALGKGYIYTFNDTSYRYGRSLPGTKGKEYAIDKYYRILKKKPNDNETRFLLLDELIKHKRIEEAYNQILDLQKYPDIAIQDRFKNKNNLVLHLRDSLYQYRVNLYSEKFNKNISDKESALLLSDAYAHLQDFDNAVDVLKKYLAPLNESDALDVRFLLAKLAAGSYKWDEAYKQTAILLKYDPSNKDYRLFNDRLVGWNVMNSKPEEIDRAINDLEKILKDNPSNLQALITMVYLNAGRSHFAEAEKYLASAQKLSPGSKELETTSNFLNSWKDTEGERILYRKRGVVAKLMEEGNYAAADSVYDEIIRTLNNPPDNILLEYAYVKTNAKKYDQAISIYNDLLRKKYNLDIDIERAKLYRYMGDSTKALEEFTRLAPQKPGDFYLNLYLGDSYMQMHEYRKAKNVYLSLRAQSKDSSVVLDSIQTAALNLRFTWLPPEGWAGFTGSFGRISLAPAAYYYKDNHDFELSSAGGSVILGVTDFLSVGALFLRTTINSPLDGNRFTSFKGNIYIRLSDYVNASAGYGTIKSNSLNNKKIGDCMLKYEKPESLMLYGSYESNDARVILFTPLLSFNYNADVYRFSGYWQNESHLKISGYLNYLSITDGNRADQVQIRIGKEFYSSVMLGYEFQYQNFYKQSLLYYSPNHFASHCLFVDWTAFKESRIKVIVGGRLGYIPASDFVIREAYIDAEYNPVQSFIIRGRLTGGSTFRFDSSYNSISASLNAYWTF